MAFYYTPGLLPFINQKALYVINMTVLKFLIHYWHLLVLVVEINFCELRDHRCTASFKHAKSLSDMESQ